MTRRIRSALSLLLAAPASALAFESVDTIPFVDQSGLMTAPTSTYGAPASAGLGGGFQGADFPAYPREDTALAPNTAFWTEIGVMHDSNPFRLANDANAQAILGTTQKADTVLRYGGGVRTDQRVYGRQHLYFEARGDYYDFDRFDQLDNFAYGLLGEWRWQLGNQLSGTAGLGRTQRLASPAEVLRPIKETIVTDRAYATGAYQFSPSWRLRGAVEGDRADRERPGLDPIEAHTQTVRGGLDYVSGLGNTVGVEARTSRGTAPVNNLVDPTGAFVGNEYKETEVAGVLTYIASSQIRFAGRLGHTERTYTEINDRDFSGTTWRALLEWLPGSKTILGFETYKAPQSVIDVAAAHVVVQGSAFTASWAPTIKWVVTGRIFEERREGVGTPESELLGVPARDETVRGYRIGVGWSPVRFAEVGVGYLAQTRDSNIDLRGFDDKQVAVNLRILF